MKETISKRCLATRLPAGMAFDANGLPWPAFSQRKAQPLGINAHSLGENTDDFFPYAYAIQPRWELLQDAGQRVMLPPDLGGVPFLELELVFGMIAVIRERLVQDERATECGCESSEKFIGLNYQAVRQRPDLMQDLRPYG